MLNAIFEKKKEKYNRALHGSVLWWGRAPLAPNAKTPLLAEHTQAFLGKPGSTETQLAIVKWYYDARLGFY